ncbi:MAG: metallophosphoesterase [Promethearchaeota archaeon]
MKLKFLAISDTHLGEDTSVLTFPQGREHLLKSLQTAFGNGEDLEIEELILVGDTGDTALASFSQVITHVNAFIQTLRSSFDIKKVVYVPGNHDHTLWTDYMNLRYGENSDHHITPPEGEFILKNSEVQCLENPKACNNLLTIFFEYDFGPAWIKIQNDKAQGKFFDFVIANPVYAIEEFNRTYVFTHGTHFKSIVTTSKLVKQAVDFLQLDQLIAGIEIDSNCDVRDASNLKELEKEIAGFVDSVWISAKNNPESKSDQLWYLYTVLTSPFEHHRSISDENKRNDYPEFIADRINKLDRNNKSIKLILEHFFGHLKNYLNENDMRTDYLTIIYGDTHEGGFGQIEENGSDIRIYNCGSWVVHHEDDHPPCHVFAVKEGGQEYLLDISFNKVNILGVPIIKLAAADFENRYSLISTVARKIINQFSPN